MWDHLQFLLTFFSISQKSRVLGEDYWPSFPIFHSGLEHFRLRTCHCFNNWYSHGGHDAGLSGVSNTLAVSRSDPVPFCAKREGPETILPQFSCQVVNKCDCYIEWKRKTSVKFFLVLVTYHITITSAKKRRNKFMCHSCGSFQTKKIFIIFLGDSSLLR